MINVNWVVKNSIFFQALYIGLLVVVSGLARAEEPLAKPSAIEQLIEFTEDQRKDEDVNGLSITVIHDQQTWFSAGSGYSDSNNKRKSSPETQYRLGAVSSVFTAMLILKLEQEGLVKLDDLISKYFPDLPFKSFSGEISPITVKQLLTHHSGLPLSVLKNSWAEKPERYQDLFSGKQAIYLSQQPDTIYTYSNLGYALLGLLIEKLTGLSYEEALQKYLLKPIGMNHSGIAKPEARYPDQAKGYKKREEKPMLFPRDLPSLGMVSSAQDMSVFIKHIFSILSGAEGVVSKAQVEQMIRIQNIHVAADLGKKVGLAWMVSGMGIEGAGPIIWRAGASLYHRSRVVLLPEKKLGVVVMANDSSAWELVESVAEKALELALEVEFEIAQPDESVKKATVEPYGISDSFADYYSSFLGFIPVVKGEKSVKAELLGWTVIAKPDGKGWYDLQYDLFGFIPIDISWITEIKVRPARISDKRVLIVLYKGTQHLFASYVDIPKASAAWVRRRGEYHLANPDVLTQTMEIKNGELVVEDNKLFFLYELPMFIGMELKVPLKTINDEMALIPGMGTALNEVVLIKRDRKSEILEYSGYLLQRD